MPSKGLGIGALGFGQLGNATIPGGNVAAVPYSPPAVIFPLPVFLRQQNSSISDCNTVTIAGLLYVPGGSANNPILEFGIRPNGLSGPQPSFNKSSIKMVRNSANDADGFGLTFCLMGSDIITDGFGNAFCHCLALGTSNTYLAGGSAGPKQTLRLSYDTWHEIFFSADVSVTTHGGETAPSSFTLTQGYTAYVFCDGLQVQLLPLAGANSTSAGWGPYQTAPANQFPGFPDYTQDQSIFNYTSPPIPVSVFGQEIGVPIETIDAGLLVSPLVYSDLQMWFGTFIDPTGTYVANNAVNPQPPFDGAQVDWPLMQMLVDAMVAGGVNPLMMMTVYNIETQYGTVFGPNSDSHQGVFQFTQAEINAAGAVGSNFNNEANAAAFVFYNTVPGPDSWITPAINQFGSDPTGINAYTVYNQGSPVARAIWNSGGGTTLGELAASKGVPVTNLTGQSWANGGTAQHPNRWAIISPTFNTALTSSDLVSTWVSRLNTIWANASSDAAGRLTGTSLQNINAFIDPKSNPIPWQLPAAQFGLQSVVFSGKAATYRTNFGNGGAFSLVNGSLIDFQPGPT